MDKIARYRLIVRAIIEDYASGKASKLATS